jgi:hypothetical protein
MQANKQQERLQTMDNVTMIRVVAGVLAVILLGVVIARRKRMASARRGTTPKR